MKKMTTKKYKFNYLNGNETKEDLALSFKIIQEQIKDSRGEVKQELEKQRDKIIKKYKKLDTEMKLDYKRINDILDRYGFKIEDYNGENKERRKENLNKYLSKFKILK